MGAQDTDLVQRLRMLHTGLQVYKKVRNPPSQAIPNDHAAKVSCCSPVYGGLRWGRMDKLNQTLFQLRRDHGQVRRNINKDQIGVLAKRITLR